MDSPEQSDLLQPRPTAIPNVTLGELEQQSQELRTLIQAALVAVLVLAFAYALFVAKQMRMVRNELSELRPLVTRMTMEFRQKEPRMKGFIAALQAYTVNNRDFQPTLDRYRAAVPEYFVVPLPVSSTAPIISPITNTAPRQR
jgi:predicted metal-binding membrane protein